jgi:energy-coupling factor transporter ATP-binding protein EcfA2
LCSVGTNWYGGDFHVHTPFSRCYRQEGVTAIAQLHALRGLDFAVIADHNSFEGYLRLCECKKERNPVIFPGVELLLPGGFAGIKLLVVLKPEFSPVELDLFLRQLGIQEQQWGNPKAIVPEPLTKVVETLCKYDAIVIWTGLDGPSGILNAVDKQQQRYILSLGWPGNLLDCNQQEGLHENTQMPIIYSSNAHSLAEIGKLTTQVKVEKLDFAGLKFALQNPEGRVLLNEVKDKGIPPHIISIKISGGFLQEEFQFNRGLNCLVGPRGAGKTTLLRLLEFALDGPERPELPALLERGEVRVKLYDGREYLQVFRKLRAAPVVLDRFGNKRNARLKEFACFYAQGEIERVVLRPEVQLELLDSLWNSAPALEDLTLISKALTENGEQLQKLEQELESYEERLAAKPSLELRLSELENFPLLEIQQQLAHRDRELLALSQAKELIRRQKQILQNFPVIPPAWEVPDCLMPALSTSKQAATDLLGLWEEAEIEINHNQAETEERYRIVEEDYQHKLGGFVDRRVRELVREREGVQAQLIALGPLVILHRELVKKAQQVSQARTKLLLNWRSLGEEICQRRSTTATELNQELNGVIRLRVDANAETSEYERLLEQTLKTLGPGTVKNLLKSVKANQLLSYVEKRDVEGLTLVSGLSLERSQSVLAILGQGEIKRGLETLVLPDMVTIYLMDGENEKAGNQLSTGQRCTAVLPLLLKAAKPPLVIDQPEDQLDNSYVYQVLVKRMRDLKEGRQFILATHNPNIPVLADAEQILVLSSDGHRGELKESGSIEAPAIKELIQSIMEGGKDAFKRRAQCYGQMAP